MPCCWQRRRPTIPGVGGGGMLDGSVPGQPSPAWEPRQRLRRAVLSIYCVLCPAPPRHAMRAVATSVLAVAAMFLPGEWGFWGSYLTGG